MEIKIYYNSNESTIQWSILLFNCLFNFDLYFLTTALKSHLSFTHHACAYSSLYLTSWSLSTCASSLYYNFFHILLNFYSYIFKLLHDIEITSFSHFFFARSNLWFPQKIHSKLKTNNNRGNLIYRKNKLSEQSMNFLNKYYLIKESKRRKYYYFYLNLSLISSLLIILFITFKTRYIYTY